MFIDYSVPNIDTEPVAAKKRSGPGGARPGAGRPRVVQDPVRLTVDYERADFEHLEAIAERRGVSVASVVREAVRTFVARRRKQ